MPSLPFTAGITASLTWFPDINGGKGGLVYFNDSGKLAWYNGLSWTILPNTLMTGYNQFSQYDPVNKVILFGNGSGLYKLNSSLVVTGLTKPPISLGINGSLVSNDPISGNFIVTDLSTGAWWQYSVTTDAWTQLTTLKNAPNFGGYNGRGSSNQFHVPIPDYGVILYFDHKTNPSTVYLYKHAEKNSTSLPPPPVSGKLPAWVNALPLWQWHAIPNTALSSVAPSVRRLGATGPSAKITAWNGATLKRSGSVYMIGAAGGHADYAGNEVDALTLNTENPKWVELRASSVNADIIQGTQFYLDKRPAATHTYYTTQFINSLNRMMIFGRGGVNGSMFPAPPADSPYIGTKRSFSFNVATNEWDSPDYIAQFPGVGGDTTAALAVKHPITEDFYYSRGYGDGWYRWSPATNTWSKLSGTTRSPWYAGAAIDPIRNRMLIIGGYTPAAPAVTNLDGKYIPTTFTGLGADVLKVGSYPGVIYDETNDDYLVIYNTATSIEMYRVNASTWKVDVPPITGTPPAHRTNGIQNAVQYVPELGGIVIANSYAGNVYFMRTSTR